MRYLDGSVSYVRSDWFLGLALVRYGASHYWERVRTSSDNSLVTDDRRILYRSEIISVIPLPTCEELDGMLGVRDLQKLDDAHAAIARKHNIAWSVTNNPCRV